MTTHAAAIAASIMGAVATAAAAAAAEPAPLTVTVEGVEARGGTFYVSVQTEAEFMGETGTDGSVVEGPAAGTFTAEYALEPGAYAVTVWHDDDGDGAFSMAPTGMPLDGWAMSGEMPMGPPSFEDAKVVVGEDGGSTTLSMTYGR